MRTLFSCLCFCACLVIVAPAYAQLPRPRVQSLFPLGFKAGDKAELTLSGDELEAVERLTFSHPGITSVPVMTAVDRVYPQGRPVVGKFTVTVAADVPPGVYEVRTAGASGVSNARRLEVSSLAEAAEVEPNNEPPQANEVALESVVNGRCDERNFDCFRFTAAANQRVFIRGLSRRVNTLARLSLVLLDASGREVARSGGATSGDSALDVTAPTAGPYTVKVYDFLYGGGASYGYRLHLTATPPPQPTQPEPPATLLTGSVHPVALPEGPTTPEQEPNDTDPQRIYPPTQIAGAFSPINDIDYYAFDAKKGDSLAIEVFSQRLGVPTDPFIVIQQLLPDGKAKDLQEVDDITLPSADKNAPLYRYPIHHSDPAWQFTAPEDGVFRILVRDLYFSSQGDPSHVYRLVVRPATTGFSLVAFPYQSQLQPPKPNIDLAPAAPLLLRGGTEPVFVQVLREPGFSGEVRLTAEALPPGITAEPVTVPAWRNHGVLVLRANGDAPPALATLKVVGKATGSDGQEVTREARAAETIHDVGNNQPAEAQLVASLPLAVIDDFTAPIAIDVGEPKVHEVARGGKLQIPIKLVKTGEFKGDLALAAFDQHPTVAIPAITLKEGQLEGSLNLEVANNAPDGTFSFYLHGLATLVLKRNPAALQSAQAEKQRIDQVVTQLQGAQDPESQAALKLAEEARKKAEQRVTDLTAEVAGKDRPVPITSPPVTIRIVPPAKP